MINNNSDNWLAPGLYILESEDVEVKVMEFEKVGVAV